MLWTLAEAVPAADAVHVLNNGAAALALVATTLAGPATQTPEIVIARGELVKIGDGFRIPELLAATGARLREVGTTNRVRRVDYADAIGPRTGFVLKVHPPNFRITGFTSSVSVTELSTLGPPVVVDIGSGLLCREPLLPDEPDATTVLSDGTTLVTASGDQRPNCSAPPGRPAAGLPGAGTELIHRLRRHPLARARRVDKLTLAALEATLLGPPTPTAATLHTSRAQLTRRAEMLASRPRDGGLHATSVGSEVRGVGGGGAPGVVLPNAAVALPPAYAATPQTESPSVLARLENGRCLLDPRALPEDADWTRETS